MFMFQDNPEFWNVTIFVSKSRRKGKKLWGGDAQSYWHKRMV